MVEIDFQRSFQTFGLKPLVVGFAWFQMMSLFNNRTGIMIPHLATGRQDRCVVVSQNIYVYIYVYVYIYIRVYIYIIEVWRLDMVFKPQNRLGNGFQYILIQTSIDLKHLGTLFFKLVALLGVILCAGAGSSGEEFASHLAVS